MKIEMKIKYNWNRDDAGEIPEMHIEAVQEDANERIFKMIQEGLREGELHTSVRYGKDKVPEEDEDSGLEYSGWWTVEKKTV